MRIMGKKAGKINAGFAASRLCAFAPLFLFACTLLSPSLSVAGVGGRPGELFNYGSGARPIAMGGAFTAVAKDASSVYYNPAGLGMLSRPNVQLMRSELFGGAYYDYAGYAGNLKGLPAGWGAEFMRLGTGMVEGRDANNNRTSSFDYTETALAAAAGMKGVFFPRLSVGAAFKFLDRRLADSADRHFAVDLGAQYGSLMRGRLDLGLAVSNVVSVAGGDTSDRLPPLLKAGAAYRLIGGVMLAAELNNDGEFRVGTEYSAPIGAARLGFEGSAVSFGLGTVFMKSYSLDVAVTRHPVLGMSNKVSLGYQFGRAGGAGKAEETGRPELMARDYQALALKELGERKYSAALDSMEKAMALDQTITDGKWGVKFRRLAAAAEKLNLKYDAEKRKLFARADEQALLAQASLTAYMEAQDLKSALYAHAAAGTDMTEPEFGEFLKVMSGLTGIPVRSDEVLSRAALVREKTRKTDVNFKTRKFDLAAKECEEIILLDENNSLAWTRLGSAYFAVGDLARARAAYDRALAIDPENGSLAEFMRARGWR
ncbi:MAG: hypothetical protein A2X28_08735 [Elusimicrobia bacterium GWA2_56_46]|nr:MAG: hypothetical protein A2X28_08735 [Elusimicrobia bacterium GWA2_56_46]OGR55220.1 MAG: hypothetical protein A2X39_01640 [Elusimicrobia bacterium GWC2_56_31]